MTRATTTTTAATREVATTAATTLAASSQDRYQQIYPISSLGTKEQFRFLQIFFSFLQKN